MSDSEIDAIQRDLARRDRETDMMLRIRWAETVAKLPCVTVDEVRDAAQLPRLEDRSLGGTVLNAPLRNGR